MHQSRFLIQLELILRRVECLRPERDKIEQYYRTRQPNKMMRRKEKQQHRISRSTDKYKKMGLSLILFLTQSILFCWQDMRYLVRERMYVCVIVCIEVKVHEKSINDHSKKLRLVVT
jgi:hypothetical protein